ncbi:MAG: HDOD domain-containing protein [Candidatus Latescibacteria bacterium]|jgi:HD-like signal output (HDOD) protein|nr:HDOD domain-containing protein [Candidatus Latescibacterota bacterium]
MVQEKNFKENKKLDKLVELVNKSDISSIKEVIMQLMTVINDPKSSAKDLKMLIEKDPPLSARLLKIANSAYYGFQRNISSIQEAIVGIGFNLVKELALSQKVCELFQKNGHFEGYSRTALWEHSIAVAICCKLTYMREFREPGENVYTAGLLHNIGIIVEDQFLQNKFKDILLLSIKDKCNLSFSEKDILGFDHADIGRAISDNWNFPDELSVAIGFHHAPNMVKGELKKITLTLYISDYICQRNDNGYCDAPYENQPLFTKCLKELNIKEKAMDFIVEDVQEEIQKMKKGGWFQNEK